MISKKASRLSGSVTGPVRRPLEETSALRPFQHDQGRASVVIEQPLEQVSAFVSDPRNDTERAGYIVEVRRTSERPLGVGASFVQVAHFLGRRLEGNRPLMRPQKRAVVPRADSAWIKGIERVTPRAPRTSAQRARAVRASETGPRTRRPPAQGTRAASNASVPTRRIHPLSGSRRASPARYGRLTLGIVREILAAAPGPNGRHEASRLFASDQ
jgi:hypothetical protein